VLQRYYRNFRRRVTREKYREILLLSWNLLNEDKVVAEDKIVMGQRHELPTKRVTKELGEEAETRMEIRIVNSANREAPKSANRAELQGAK
jgi:hypothetical protein